MPGSRLRMAAFVLTVYFAASLLILAAVLSSRYAVPDFNHSVNNSLIRMTLFDGQWYIRIAASGYSYNPRVQSTVVFFPGYPLAIRIFAKCFLLNPNIACIMASWFFLLLAYLGFVIYLKNRSINGAASDASIRYAIMSLAVFPTTLFFHMAYTESMFLFFMILAFIGMSRRWFGWCIALIVGACTGIRSVGIAMLVPFIMYMLHSHYITHRDTAARLKLPPLGRFISIVKMLALSVLATWGLLAFIIFQSVKFNDPTLFVKGEAKWHQRATGGVRSDIARLVTLEPIWSTYVSGSDCYWGNHAPKGEPLLNPRFMDPLYFVMIGLSIVYGARYRLLNWREMSLSALLILIPYCLQAPRQCMVSEGRFVAIVFPAFIVFGQMLSRLPWLFRISILVSSAILLFVDTILFSAGYPFI